MRMALVSSGIVKNIVIGSSDFAMSGYAVIPCDDSVGRWDLYNGSSFFSASKTLDLSLEYSPGQFVGLLTDEEKSAIFDTDNIVVKAGFAELMRCPTIRISDTITIVFLNYLLSIGIMSDTHAAEILTGPTT